MTDPKANSDNSKLVENLIKLASGNIYARGAQAYVSRGGECLIDVAVGWSLEPDLMQKHTLHNPWCASKPIGALAIGILADRGEIDLDAPIGEQFSDTHRYRVAKFSPRDILYHNAGLGNPRMHLAWLWPDDVIEAQVYEAVQQGEPNQPIYSEYTGWIVLDAYIRDKTKMSSREFIGNEILKPLELENDIYVWMTLDELEKNQYDIGPTYFNLPLTKMPHLNSRTIELTCTKNRMGSFALVTMRGMGRIYEGVLKTLKGTPIEGLPTPATTQDLTTKNRGIATDEIINAESDFAGGFMLALKSLGFTGLSENAFGYSAMSGTIFMFADPERDLSAAVHLNGSGRGPRDIEYLVGTLTNSILDDYENLDSPVDIDELKLKE